MCLGISIFFFPEIGVNGSSFCQIDPSIKAGKGVVFGAPKAQTGAGAAASKKKSSDKTICIPLSVWVKVKVPCMVCPDLPINLPPVIIYFPFY